MTNGRDGVVAGEAAVERRYARYLEGRLTTRAQRSRHTVRTQTPELPEGSLVGRVLLSSSDAQLGGHRDFYIGDRHVESLEGDLRVFSWSAPVAALFFGFGRSTRIYFDSTVTVRRTFVHERGRLTAFEDEPTHPSSSDSFSDLAFTAPPAPRRAQLPIRPGIRTGGASRDPDILSSRDAEVRSGSILRAALEKPRTQVMAPVLSTLQPDQYDHVTADPTRPILLDGGPGSGKSVIAAHRAVYLDSSDARRSSGSGTILLVGPTSGYVEHVRGVTSALSPGSGDLRVVDLPGLMDEIARLPAPAGLHASRARDTSRDRLLRAQSYSGRYGRTRSDRRTGRQKSRTEHLYERLRANDTSLPPWNESVKRRDRRSLIAGLALIAGITPSWAPVAHVIVDEAQDLTPEEWEVLRLLNPGESWTLLGDLDQRRSPLSTWTWSDLGTMLFGTGGKSLEHVVITRAYRSTAAILDFANQLLPPGARGRTALRTRGDSPVVEKVAVREIWNRTASAAEELCARYPTGTVAVIADSPVEVRDHLHRQGWTVTGPASREMSCRTSRIQVLSPFAARGLEFDGVVVLEPADLHERGARHGQLYTALTRANQTLMVIHSKPLPDELVRNAPSESRRPPAGNTSQTEPPRTRARSPWVPGATGVRVSTKQRSSERSGRCPDCQNSVPLMTGTGAVASHDADGSQCPGTGMTALR